MHDAIAVLRDLIACGIVYIDADSLSDHDLDALLDIYVFRQASACNGYCAYQRTIGAITEYRCSVCGAIVERTMAQRLFESVGSHPRRIPHYTESMASAWPIIEAMRRQSVAAQICFRMLLRTHRSVEHAGIFGMTPRIVALAALQALSVLDQHGRLIEHKAAI